MSAHALVRRTEESERLLERILQALPVENPAFHQLLEILEIKVCREVETAAVTLEHRPRLRINPDFVMRHCATREALAMLVMHELLHVMLGHTRWNGPVDSVHNLAFDALINAQLCQAFPEPRWTGLFRRLYRPDALPYAWLRPPPGWGESSVRWCLQGRALQVHQLLYSSTQLPLTDLIDAILSLCPRVDILLLGGHEPVLGQKSTVDPLLQQALDEIGQRYPQPLRGAEATLSCHAIVPKASPDEVRRQFRRALWPLLHEAGVARSPQPETEKVIMPLPSSRDRRAWLGRLLGWQTLLQTHVRPQARNRGGSVHIYLDVSGSMAHWLPHCYGELLAAREALYPEVHLFSTRVRDIDLQALREGQVDTWWGTEIECVARHMLKHDVKHALIITDGWVGRVPEHLVARLRQGRRVHVFVTHAGEWLLEQQAFLQDFNARAFFWKNQERPSWK